MNVTAGDDVLREALEALDEVRSIVELRTLYGISHSFIETMQSVLIE